MCGASSGAAACGTACEGLQDYTTCVGAGACTVCRATDRNSAGFECAQDNTPWYHKCQVGVGLSSEGWTGQLTDFDALKPNGLGAEANQYTLTQDDFYIISVWRFVPVAPGNPRATQVSNCGGVGSTLNGFSSVCNKIGNPPKYKCGADPDSPGECAEYYGTSTEGVYTTMNECYVKSSCTSNDWHKCAQAPGGAANVRLCSATGAPDPGSSPDDVYYSKEACLENCTTWVSGVASNASIGPRRVCTTWTPPSGPGPIELPTKAYSDQPTCQFSIGGGTAADGEYWGCRSALFIAGITAGGHTASCAGPSGCPDQWGCVPVEKGDTANGPVYDSFAECVKGCSGYPNGLTSAIECVECSPKMKNTPGGMCTSKAMRTLKACPNEDACCVNNLYGNPGSCCSALDFAKSWMKNYTSERVFAEGCAVYNADGTCKDDWPERKPGGIWAQATGWDDAKKSCKWALATAMQEGGAMQPGLAMTTLNMYFSDKEQMGNCLPSRVADCKGAFNLHFCASSGGPFQVQLPPKTSFPVPWNVDCWAAYGARGVDSCDGVQQNGVCKGGRLCDGMKTESSCVGASSSCTWTKGCTFTDTGAGYWEHPVLCKWGVPEGESAAKCYDPTRTSSCELASKEECGTTETTASQSIQLAGGPKIYCEYGIPPGSTDNQEKCYDPHRSAENQLACRHQQAIMYQNQYFRTWTGTSGGECTGSDPSCAAHADEKSCQQAGCRWIDPLALKAYLTTDPADSTKDAIRAANTQAQPELSNPGIGWVYTKPGTSGITGAEGNAPGDLAGALWGGCLPTGGEGLGWSGRCTKQGDYYERFVPLAADICEMARASLEWTEEQ